ncbi:MAG: fatty acid--CoA ligase family protein [Acidimicrobiales bacterium]
MCPVGSAPIAPATLATLQARMPNAMVSNSWGMTEAGPSFCFLPPEEQARRVGSVGKPMKPTEFRIIDPTTGDELPAREIGELLVRNPGREREYFGDAEATASTWKDGWLHSGDLAYLDEDGYLYLVGRQKDMIIRGGNNIHAGDVEAVLYEHPAVQEAAVAGVPHDVLGEDVGAWIVLAPGATADADELRAFCAERLSDYKVPAAGPSPPSSRGTRPARSSSATCGSRPEPSSYCGRAPGGRSSTIWPSRSRTMIASPPTSVSSSTSPPSSRTRSHVAATSSTVSEMWVRPGSVKDRSRGGSFPDRSKWRSSRTAPPASASPRVR